MLRRYAVEGSGIDRVGTEGSQKAILAASRRGVAAMQAREWTLEERELHRRLSLEMNLGRHLQTGYHGPRWTAEELALLGTAPDTEVAQRIGKSVNAVRCRRQRAGIEKVNC